VKSAAIGLVLAAALAGTSGAALADSTPIVPLPAGPVASIEVEHGELVAVALPSRSGGRVWRLARPVDTRVVNEVSEANVGSSVVLVFRARRAGATTIALALARSDTSSVALESRRFHIRVR